MTKPHSSPDWKSFGAEISGLVKNRGYSGYFGYSDEKANEIEGLVVTKSDTDRVTKNSIWLPEGANFGPSNNDANQEVGGLVTKVTAVTNTFEGIETAESDDLAPPALHAILAELERQNPVDWLSPERWNFVLADAEIFLSQWGCVAHRLGWTALDLFGVHPIAPAARFDAMGLLLLIQGGDVIALTADAAALRSKSSAALTYRRPDYAGAVLLSEVQ